MSLQNLSSMLSLIWLCCFFSISTSQAQESEKQKVISLYNHSDHQSFNYSFIDQLGVTHNYQKDVVDYLNIGVGYRIINEKNRFHELSLVQFNYAKSDDTLFFKEEDQVIIEPISGSSNKEVNLRLRWEYGLNVKLNNNDKIIPSLSVGIDPYWNHYRSVPKTSAGVPVTFNQYGWDLQLLPGTAFQLTPSMQIHISTPITLIQNQWNSSKIENPLLTEDQRSQSSFDSDFGIVGWEVRVGVGFRI